VQYHPRAAVAFRSSYEKPHVSFLYTSREGGVAVAVAAGSSIVAGDTGDGVRVGGTDVGTGVEAGAHPLVKTDRKMNTMKNKIEFFISPIFH
jgi:hypothetical protein